MGIRSEIISGEAVSTWHVPDGGLVSLFSHISMVQEAKRLQKNVISLLCIKQNVRHYVEQRMA